MISQETIEEIKERVRLVEVASESIDLRQRGGNFVGLCPFHSEKTPSFQIRDAENYYHCFGCGASGNVITFVMELQGVSFPEAVEYLAAKHQIELKYDGPVRKEGDALRKRRLYQINQDAQNFFRKSLSSAEPAVKAYLKERGIRAEAIEAFGIGYAPQRWGALSEHLRGKQVAEENLVSAGLARRNQKGELYDSFRGRLMFPVWIDPHRIAGFGGRVIPALLEPEARTGAPKYLNSPETPVYQKNKILFGLPQAMKAIKEEKCLLLVEGYMDVVGLWQAGVRNAVATCGTAVTEQHCQRMADLTNKVFVVFDGDAAGRNAAARCFTVFLNSGVDARALFLPNEEDPDSLARSKGAKTREYLEELKTRATPLLDCYIISLLRTYGVESAAELGAASKGKLAEDIAKILAKVTSEIERSELVKQAAFRLIVDESQLQQLIEGGKSAIAGKPAEFEPEPAEMPSRLSVADLPTFDRMLLHAVMGLKESLTGVVLRRSDVCEALKPCSRLFVEGLHEIVHDETASEGQKKERLKALLKSFGPSWMQHWKQSYQMLEDRSVSLERLFDECLQSLEQGRLREARRQLEARVKQCTDSEERQQMLLQLVELSRKLSRVPA